MLEIIIATRNRHKFRELATLLKVPRVRWRSLAECPRAPDVRETGKTFDENAVRKARAAARTTKHLALADDSGLEVEALGWAPGIRSARFSGRHGDDQASNEKLLRLLSGWDPRKRRARYRCTLALADPAGRVLALTRGTWYGRIAEIPKGHHGFGYDPIFFVPRLGKTVGQLATSVKQRLSHRARAARKMRQVLKRMVRSLASQRTAFNRCSSSSPGLGPVRSCLRNSSRLYSKV